MQVGLSAAKLAYARYQARKRVYLLHCGGGKSSRKRDIVRAKVKRKQLDEE